VPPQCLGNEKNEFCWSQCFIPCLTVI
jgi:hypothetical protein